MHIAVRIHGNWVIDSQNWRHSKSSFGWQFPLSRRYNLCRNITRLLPEHSVTKQTKRDSTCTWFPRDSNVIKSNCLSNGQDLYNYVTHAFSPRCAEEKSRQGWTFFSSSFSESLILPPPGASEERPWLGMVTYHFDNWNISDTRGPL